MSATGNADFGYFGGGYVSAAISTVDRVDYSNDTATASPKGPLSLARNQVGATGNASFGYFGGGYVSADISTVDRIDYSNDTGTTPTKGPLSLARNNTGACSSRANAIPTENIVNYAAGTTTAPNKGYFFGGWSNSSNIYRIDYSNDVFENLTSKLLFSGYGGAGLSSKIHGYHVGGYPAALTYIQRINYFNDTVSQVHPISTPAISSTYMAGIFNDDYGWYVAKNKTALERMEFSNDVNSSSPKGNLLTPGDFMEATVGNSSYGYFHRGGGSISSSIQRIDYSNDTANSQYKGPLPVSADQTGGTGTADYGYIGGGGAPASTSNIYRIDYSNDTADASLRNNLYQAMDRMTATGNSSFGYFTGYPSANFSKLDFSNDTATVSTNIPISGPSYIWYISAASAKEFGLNNIGPAVIANTTEPSYPSNVFGYFRTNASNVNRFNFANDTAAAVHLPNNLAPGTGNKSMAYSSATHAYFSRADTQRIDYSNDTATYVTVGGMPTARYEGAAVQNLTHGYVLGGFATSVYRLDFANDTETMSTRGNLVSSRSEFGAAGNLTHAYTMGNGDAQKIDYSNDTATSVFLSPTISGSSNTYATGSINFGYLASSGTIQRYDYSNDTGSPNTYVSFASNLGSNGGASGTASFGYFTGFGPAYLSRLDYANDTVTPKTKGNLANVSVQYGTGTSTTEFGLRG